LLGEIRSDPLTQSLEIGVDKIMKTNRHFLSVFEVIRMLMVPVLIAMAAGIPGVASAQASPSQIGIVIMHGKGGSPNGLVSELARSLEGKGYLVANLEMPWSKRRDYDVTVSAAEKEVETALDALRKKGAKKVFVVGHSQGGVFALYFGGNHKVDGVVTIAPGGHVGNALFREKLGESVARARKLIAEGKGDEKTAFMDFEGSKGTYPVHATPGIYLTWFDPEGAMNQVAALKTMNPQVPVLYIAPLQDYPGLLKVKQSMFNSLPRNPLTKLYEPAATHVGAPTALRDEIMRWTTEVSGGQK
jgi:pimeloyl-ACP methyl ester carboxylesterase